MTSARDWRQEAVRVVAAIAGLLAVALLAIVVRSAGAHDLEQPDRVLVATTGDNSERVATLDIGTTPGANKEVVMSLTPDKLPRLKRGDRLNVSSELMVTTDCLAEGPGCSRDPVTSEVGSPYDDYDPIVESQLTLAPSGDAVDGLPISDLKRRTCLQQRPNREHHCVLVFRDGALDVPDEAPPALPCPRDGCYVNLVVSVHHPDAQSGQKLIIGEDEPDGTIVQDKGRINAVRLRPIVRGPEPVGEVRTFLQDEPMVGELVVGTSQQRQRTVVFSQQLSALKKDEQLSVDAEMETDISHLGYNARISSQLILASSRGATRTGALVERVAELGGHLTEMNGFNCTQATTPCLTEKVGVGRLIADAVNESGSRVPLFVNLVAVNNVIGGGVAQPGDEIKITGGSLEVVRYPATRRG
jgi:hypothetical protein